MPTAIIRLLRYSLFLLLLFVLTACGTTQVSSEPSDETTSATNSSTSDTQTVTDDFGHELTIPVQPEKVFAPYQEDALTTLGVTPIAKYSVNGTVQTHLESALEDVPSFEMASGISPEALLELDPDLVIVSSHFLPTEQYDPLAKIAPVYLLDSSSTDWEQSLRTIAELLGKSDQVEQKMTDYSGTLEDAKTTIAQQEQQRETYIVFPGEKEFFIVGSDFLSGKVLYGELGLTPPNIATETPDNFTSMSLEMIPELGDSNLFVITPEGQTTEQVKTLLDTLPLWSDLPAVQNDRVFHVDTGHWINSGYMANLAVTEDVLAALTSTK
ncbi:ABC transporter substrate-binding protein [Aureibacillus halotolerans]|uniref:Iron complex transport system substrate-binding protein n=1 Tax=Aureibacillus halotolerans TaxID=1508390 RepID=A0A4V6PWD1_9BACI|nr:ABC transporter substrate-binding protein [Aureibacillus halotolerans]TDQ33755.1 iron complex transport system substrate-binding protein [Aureibacillus halotolerans]